MNRNAIVFLSTALLIGLPAAPQAAFAQTARGGGEASAQAMQQLQQLAAERTRLQAENASLKEELEKLRREAGATKAEQGKLEQRARAAQAGVQRSSDERERLSRELEQQRERLEELLQKSREIVDTLREVEADRATLRQTLTRTETDLRSCAQSNLALRDINSEALARLEDRSFMSCLAGAEPFTGLKRVEIENLADEYRARAEELTVPPAVESAAPDSAEPPR